LPAKLRIAQLAAKEAETATAGRIRADLENQPAWSLGYKGSWCLLAALMAMQAPKLSCGLSGQEAVKGIDHTALE
jgi:hypothetical protein